MNRSTYFIIDTRGVEGWPGGVAWLSAFSTLASMAVALVVFALAKMRDARSLALASFIAAVAASIVVLIWPVYESGTISSSTGTQVIERHMVWFGLLRGEGPRFLLYVAAPIGVTALGVQAFRIEKWLLRVTAAWTVAVFWLLLDLAAMFTIGMFYLPSAILMIFAALKASTQKIDADPSRPGTQQRAPTDGM